MKLTLTLTPTEHLAVASYLDAQASGTQADPDHTAVAIGFLEKAVINAAILNQANAQHPVVTRFADRAYNQFCSTRTRSIPRSHRAATGRCGL